MNRILYKLIGQKIKKVREESNLTQQQLADLLHKTRSSISNIENGIQAIQLQNLYVIAQGLGRDVYEFLPSISEVKGLSLTSEEKMKIYEEDLTNIFLPVSAARIGEVELKIVNDVGSGDKPFLNMPDIDKVRGKVCKIDVIEIAKLVEKNNPSIF